MMNILRGAPVVKFIVASGLALVVGLGTTNIGVAEDGKGVGRTADGRAYRVDNQGNEIVDYIAELELQQDALNRRIYGLEAEIAEKIRSLSESVRAAVLRKQKWRRKPSRVATCKRVLI